MRKAGLPLHKTLGGKWLVGTEIFPWVALDDRKAVSGRGIPGYQFGTGRSK